MKEYLAKARDLNSYMGSYTARRKNNHHVLLEVAEELKKLGCTCYTCKEDFERERTDLIHVFNKEGKSVCFGFAEVPYRWYIDSEHGQNVRYLIGEHGYDYPFDAEEILGKITKTDKYGNERFNSPFYIRL